jgi:hypothetical protein
MGVCKRIAMSDLDRFVKAFVEKYGAEYFFDRETPTTYFNVIKFGKNEVDIYVDKDNQTGFRYGWNCDAAMNCVEEILRDFQHI